MDWSPSGAHASFASLPAIPSLQPPPAVRSEIVLFLAKPLRVGDGAVKVVSCFVEFELAGFCRLCRLGEKSCYLGRVHRLKSPGGLEGLLKDRKRIAARDDDAGGKIHRIVQTLDRGSGLATEYEMVAHGFHTQNSDIALGQDRQHLLLETVEVGVHYVERHLDGIEREAMLCGGGQHL